jgi:hypothetical protein
MNLLNGLNPMAGLLSAKEKLVAKLAERKQLLTDLEAGLDDMRQRLGEAADKALDKGDDKAYERLADGIGTQEKKIEVARASIQHAEKLVVEAQQAINNHRKDDINRNLQRVLRQRDKAARELFGNAEAYAASVKHFKTINDRLRHIIVNAGLRVPSDALLSDGELADAIGRLLLRAAPWNGIGHPEDNLVPGAKFQAYHGNPTKWAPFTDEVEQRNSFLSRYVSNSGPDIQAPVAFPAAPPAQDTPEAVQPDTGVEPAPEGGRTYTIAEATAHMNRGRIDLSKL